MLAFACMQCCVGHLSWCHMAGSAARAHWSVWLRSAARQHCAGALERALLYHFANKYAVLRGRAWAGGTQCCAGALERAVLSFRRRIRSAARVRFAARGLGANPFLHRFPEARQQGQFRGGRTQVKEASTFTQPGGQVEHASAQPVHESSL